MDGVGYYFGLMMDEYAFETIRSYILVRDTSLFCSIVVMKQIKFYDL